MEDFQLHHAFGVGQVLRSRVTDSGWIVEDVLGGGYGSVYVVQDVTGGYRYVLKTLQVRYLWSKEERIKFERELITWVMLDRHPHVVSAFWVERLEDFPCLVLEYMDGGSLWQLLNTVPLSLARGIELGTQCCEGISYVHSKLGIVHRDVKPENCLLTRSGVLKIADFGLARRFVDPAGHPPPPDRVEAALSTGQSLTSGTRPYMAPEQERGYPRLDARADIHAFGVMFYQMLTGDLKWPAEEKAWEHINGSSKLAMLPCQLRQLILRCIDREPRSRPQNFREVGKVLAASYGQHLHRTLPPSAPTVAMTAHDWQNKAVALEALGYFEESLECFERALAQHPLSAELLQGRGTALYRLQRYLQALDCFDLALRQRPGDAGLLTDRGLALQGLGRWDDALASHRAALLSRPGDSAILRNIADVLDLTGKPGEALRYYNQGLDIDKRDFTLAERRGFVLLELEQYENALRDFDAGLRIAPTECGLWLGKGIALVALTRYKEALPCFDSAAEFGEPNSELYKYRGRALLYLGSATEALNAFDQGLRLEANERVTNVKSIIVDPKHFDARSMVELLEGKSAALLLLHRAEEALGCLQKALPIAPDDSELYKDMGAALIDLHRPEEALEWLERGVKLNGRDHYIWRNIGRAHLSLRNARKAFKAFDKAASISATDPEAWVGRAAALLQRGDVRPAADSLLRGLQEAKNIDGACASVARFIATTEDAAALLAYVGTALRMTEGGAALSVELISALRQVGRLDLADKQLAGTASG